MSDTPSPTTTSQQAAKSSFPLPRGERSVSSGPSPARGEGARLGEPLGEPSRSGKGGFATHTQLLARAKFMRSNPTEAERKLWQVLRNKRLAGHKFKRQVVLDWYIADFVNFEHRLIVEADGSQHAESDYDARRDAHLRGEGFAVLRFWNNDILARHQLVEDAIWAALQRPPLPGLTACPSPARGEGLSLDGVSSV